MLSWRGWGVLVVEMRGGVCGGETKELMADIIHQTFHPCWMVLWDQKTRFWSHQDLEGHQPSPSSVLNLL